MSEKILLSFSLVSAITLALAYHPILEKLSLGLVSPYAKADLTKRALAAMVDGSLVAITLFYDRSSGSPLYLVAGVAYLLLRDVAGRSVGKFLFGLVVTDLETGRPCGWRASISRNILLPLPGANVVAAFLEASTIVRDPQGQRLGDRFALTQVVEGFGAKDLLTGVLQWLLDIAEELTEQLGDKGRRPGRVPEKVQLRIEIRLPDPLSDTTLKPTSGAKTVETKREDISRRSRISV
jgi:uncharacterized RDD family membrane protein YckC